MTQLIHLADLVSQDPVSDNQKALHGGAISIGNFDGVHEGHADLLARNRELANKVGGPAIAVVLSPHPAEILRPNSAPPTLTWMERRAELMKRVGIDFLAVCKTSVSFLELSATEFFERLVVGQLRAKAVVEGPNFYFGKGREGTVQTLQTLCTRYGIELDIVKPRCVSEKMISSTRVRGLLQACEIETAVTLLGQPYRIRGTVVGGAQRGRQIGFPTANLDRISGILPGPGVYGGTAMAADNPNETHLAAIHIGPNPTFEASGALKTEVHLLDFSGDLYGRVLLVDFVTCVRDVKRFESADELKQQLSRDIHTIRERLT